MGRGGKPGEAAADNDDVGLVAALEWGVYLLVFEVGRLEPEIVEKVFVQLRRFRRIVAELFKAVGDGPCAGRAGGSAAQECASGHFPRAARLRTARTSAHRTFLPYWNPGFVSPARDGSKLSGPCPASPGMGVLDNSSVSPPKIPPEPGSSGCENRYRIAAVK